MLTHTAKVDISPTQYQRIKREKRHYAEAQLRKQYGGQWTEASKRENGEALEEQSLKEKKANEEPSDISSRPSSSQEGDG